MLAAGALSPPLPRLYAHAALSAIVPPDHNTLPYRVQLLGQAPPYRVQSLVHDALPRDGRGLRRQGRRPRLLPRRGPPPPPAVTSGARDPPHLSRSSPNGRSTSRPPDVLASEEAEGRQPEVLAG